MNKKIASEIVIGIILFVAVIIGVVVYQNGKGKMKNTGKTPEKITQISQEEAYNLLKKQYDLWQLKNGKECNSFGNCFKKSFSENEKKEIALAYGVISTGAENHSIYIDLLKGSSVSIPGIGTGYLENKNKLGLQDTDWYWEIGSCPTNKRIYINAITGKPGLLHDYVYCGGEI